MPNYDLTPEYEALYNANDKDIFSDEEYDKLKKAGRLPEGSPTSISSEAIIKALENLDLANGANVDEKQRIRDKNWYGTGVESDELKKAKYGDIPDHLADEPSPEEDKPLERGPKWDPVVSEEDILRDKMRNDSVDDEEGPSNIEELLAGLDKPDVSVTKTTVSKGDAKKNGLKAKEPVKSISKEKVELSADDLKPKSKSSLWDSKGEGMKFEGPEDKAKKDFQGKLEKDYKGVPFHEGGVNEEELFGFLPGSEHKSAMDVLKDVGTGAVLGTAAGRALKHGGKYLGGKVGRLFGRMKSKIPEVPNPIKDAHNALETFELTKDGPAMLAKERDAWSPVAKRRLEKWNPENAKMARLMGEEPMFQGVEGAVKNKTKFGSGKGVVGRRLNLTEKGTGDVMANRSAAPDITVERGEVPGLRSEVRRHEGKFGRTSITQSDMKRLTQQLNELTASGRLTREKYAEILKGLGRNPVEIEAELAKAFR
jgi:hypothetical protein